VTHPYIPNTDADIRRMLEAVGVKSVDDLFTAIPPEVRLSRDLDLPPAMGEQTLLAHLESLAAKNADPARHVSFAGGGVYRHFAPSFIDQLLLRSEFYTAYTPYQPEMAQGTLQAIFEFQTMVCQLTGMDLANASMYDGSTAMAESALMASRLTKRDKIVVARTVHPCYRDVLRTYVSNLGIEIVEVAYGPDGAIDAGALDRAADGAAALVFQYPNFFGVIEDPRVFVAAARRTGALSVATVTEPVALGLLKPPGELGVDIVAAELQSFGIPSSYGGPHCGVVAASEKCLRQMPGRLVGVTKDTEGRSGFVLTLSTREQHIRREKATSNICTNSGLMALCASMFMAAYGKQGLPELARINLDRAHFAQVAVTRAAVAAGVRPRFSGPFFNEFVIGGLRDADRLHARLADDGVIAGIALGRLYPELADSLLISVTELNSADEIERLAHLLARRASGDFQ
jgi:glycine dehydrogenase subunit 1